VYRNVLSIRDLICNGLTVTSPVTRLTYEMNTDQRFKSIYWQQYLTVTSPVTRLTYEMNTDQRFKSIYWQQHLTVTSPVTRLTYEMNTDQRFKSIYWQQYRNQPKLFTWKDLAGNWATESQHLAKRQTSRPFRRS